MENYSNSCGNSRHFDNPYPGSDETEKILPEERGKTI